MKITEKINKKIFLPLILGLTLLSSILFYKLDQQYMWTDEIFSFHAAEMLIEKGEAMYDSGLAYRRAPVYHHLLAESMKMFGTDEFGSRVVNIPFAIGTVLLCFLFIVELLKKSPNRYLYATAGALLFLTANFTIASVRETRMYTVETFFFTGTIFTFYKAFLSSINTSKTSFVKARGIWVALFLLSFFLAYNTQAISVLFGLGVFVFLLVASVINRNRETFILAVLLGLVGLLAIYLEYGTLDLLAVFATLAPPWGTESPNYLYYPVLLVRNFPGVFIISPLILWNIYKIRRTEHLYLITVFMTFLLFISIQTAQNERYLTPVIPLMLILAVTCLSDTLQKLTRTSFYYVLVALLIGTIGAQLYLFKKELNEIDTYTSTSISIHKKFQFNKLFEYLKKQDLDGVTLIADDQSAYTLYQKGFKADYIIVPENKDIITSEITEGKIVDIYFNIEFLSYKEQFDEFLDESERPVLLILRNYEDFSGIEDRLNEVKGFKKPRVYRED